MRAIPIQRRAGDTRDGILAAAKEVIAEVGRDRFTTQMITERLGVSVGTFYRYFTDRVDILDALYPERIEGLNGWQKKPFPRCGDVLDDRKHRSTCYRVLGHTGPHSNGHTRWGNAQ